MRRLILLGASNVTIAFPLIVESLRASFGEPIELIAAHGHGRSFGKRSRVLWRDLPGISVCRMWDELDRRPPSPHPPLALMTDIGNDLLYGVRPPQLLEWVETCMQRLQAAGAELAVALPPRDSVLRISAARYYATRAIFFPGGGPGWSDMQQMFHEVDAGLLELTGRYGAATIRPEPRWYGIDPIHIRKSARRTAWETILSAWAVGSRDPRRWCSVSTGTGLLAAGTGRAMAVRKTPGTSAAGCDARLRDDHFAVLIRFPRRRCPVRHSHCWKTPYELQPLSSLETLHFLVAGSAGR